MYQTQNAASEHCRSDMLPRVSRWPRLTGEFALGRQMFDSDVDKHFEQQRSDMDLKAPDVLSIIPGITLLAITLDHEAKIGRDKPSVAEKEWLNFHFRCIRST